MYTGQKETYDNDGNEASTAEGDSFFGQDADYAGLELKNLGAELHGTFSSAKQIRSRDSTLSTTATGTCSPSLMRIHISGQANLNILESDDADDLIGSENYVR